MILIPSAAYVEREFQIEYGALPPTLLPIENLRLYELQIDTLKTQFPEENIYISLPLGYKLNRHDQIKLKSLKVSVIYHQEDVSLGCSIYKSIVDAALTEQKLIICHGDTLVTKFSSNMNSIGIGICKDEHQWQIDDRTKSDDHVWCGYFSFNTLNLFLECLISSGYDFVDAVRLYDINVPLQRDLITHWYDFGHLSTYFQSRSKLTTERSFNTLNVEDGRVIKSGLPLQKIRAEHAWYSRLSDDLLVYSPQLTKRKYGHKDNPESYQTEFLPLPPLNEVFVHGRNSERYWRIIFSLIDKFLCTAKRQKFPKNNYDKIIKSSKCMIEKKPLDRLEEYISSGGTFGLSADNKLNGESLPSIYEIVDSCVQLLADKDFVIGEFHGDLCLSNILYDSRTQRIKVVDPRGLDYDGFETNFGDLTYDVAKLTHSVIGLYDHIISGAYKLEISETLSSTNIEFDIYYDRNIENIQKVFKSQIFMGDVNFDSVMPQTILLFISMVPLHSDRPDRQFAFLANALRLYSKYIKGKHT